MRLMGALLTIVFGCLFVDSQVFAAADEKAAAFVLCKHQKNVRTIRVMPDQDKENCTITYSRGGVDEVVGSNRSVSACKSILKNIQDNLESSKWSCRDVRSARVTTSSEVVRQ